MAKVSGVHDSGLPAGTIVPCGNSAALPRTLMCDGSAVSRTAYPALFAAIGTSFGSGDGSTTFNVPNLQGVFPRGAGTQNRYTFTVTSANATAGAIYSNNSQTFTVLNTISGSTTLIANGSGAPTASGTLTKTSGTGDATITFSANIAVAYSGTLGNHQADKMQGHRHSALGGQFIQTNSTGTVRNFIGTSPAAYEQTTTGDLATDSSNIAPRTGLETAPANLGVNYCIAY